MRQFTTFNQRNESRLRVHDELQAGQTNPAAGVLVKMADKYKKKLFTGAEIRAGALLLCGRSVC